MDGEFRRQRQFMERSVVCLQRKAMRDAQKADHTVAVRMRENAELIEQLNDLRRENTQLNGKLSSLQVRSPFQRGCTVGSGVFFLLFSALPHTHWSLTLARSCC